MLKRILHYRLVEKIGEGRNGEVYRTWDSDQRRWVAAKLIRPEIAADFAFQKQMVSRTRAVSRVDHPNIATVAAIEKDQGNYLIESELVSGQTLRDLIQSGKLDRRRLLDIVIEVTAGLMAAQSRMIPHGNLRSSNIMLTPDGHVKLLDFGLNCNPRRTAPDLTPDDIAYLAPEQLEGNPAHAASDLYSLGVVIYEMITGRLLLTAYEPGASPKNVRYRTPDLSLLRGEAIPGEILLLLEKLLAVNPDERFAGPGELMITLEAIHDFEVKHPKDTPADGRKATPRQYLMISLLVVLLVILWSIIASHYN
ncbi:MAG: serine/threonine protein kinase [candidate division Zixibacteria bacterium]|nr:serine/threonine protein kinase [candidate division Zixibacteria bacterium]